MNSPLLGNLNLKIPLLAALKYQKHQNTKSHLKRWCYRYFYRPQRKLREGDTFTPVCQSFCSRGGGGGCTPLGRHPQPIPPGRHPLRRPLQGIVRILLECILVLLKIFGGHQSFLWGHWYPCFGLMVMSAWVSKWRWIPCLPASPSASNGIFRFTSGDLLAASIAAAPRRTCRRIQALVALHVTSIYSIY